MRKMTDKDNIKLKTDTPSPRKSGSSIGVHVKRKRKIIAQPLSSQAPHSSRSPKKEEKTQENKAQNSHQDTNDKRSKSGIYLRDDHCDWGSSGMNEFTNEYNSN